MAMSKLILHADIHKLAARINHFKYSYGNVPEFTMLKWYVVKIDTLLWILRVWALCVGSAVLPCVLIISTVRKLGGRTGVHLTREYYLKGIESGLVVSLFMVLPIESLLKDSPRVIPWVWSALPLWVWIGIAWMIERLIKMVGMWVFGLHLIGRANGHSKPKSS